MNSKEIILNNILIKYFPLYFEYIGKGKFKINNYTPDFINIKKKKIIELYGEHWHSYPSTILKDIRKEEDYLRLGWQLLVIYVNDLKSEGLIIKKVKEFIK